ncbi:MAG: hypothetical protein ACPG8W_06935 [Candidatus Promineifilaceae bacterium]
MDIQDTDILGAAAGIEVDLVIAASADVDSDAVASVSPFSVASSDYAAGFGKVRTQMASAMDNK